MNNTSYPISNAGICGNTRAVTAPDVRKAQIDVEMDELEQNLGRACRGFDQLASKLDLVMIPLPPAPESANATPQPARAPLAERIHQSGRRATVLASYIESIGGRVEL